MENIKKHMYRVQQLAQQTVGRAEKSEVRSQDLQQVEQRVETMIEVLHHLKSKLSDCIRSRVKEENLEKRRKKLDEYNLALMLFNDARQLHNSSNSDLLAPVMNIYASSLFLVTDGIVQMEMDIEKQVFEGLSTFFEAEKNMLHYKEKLKKLVLDMDAAKTRLAAVQARGEKSDHIQEESLTAHVRMENCKDNFANEVFALASKEFEMAKIFANLIQTQMQFYKSAYESLQDCFAMVSKKIDSHPRRPVYGLDLDKHLEYSGRDIALVMEVCCAALCDIALDVEGLFRIPGNALRVRRLKSSFDAGEINLSEYEFDPHAIAGALKQYLRELPQPLLSDAFYKEWVEAVSTEKPAERLRRVRNILNRLPENNLKNIRYLVKFLDKVAQNQSVNKMSCQNLAIVFGPTLLWTSDEDSATATPNAVVSSVVECLISNASYFFPDDIVFNSPLIVSLHSCDISGVRGSSANLSDWMETSSNNGDKSSVDNACSRSSSSFVSPPSKPVAGKKVKSPAPPPPVQFAARRPGHSENANEQRHGVIRQNSSCSSLSDRHSVGCSFESDEHSENSSWVGLEIVDQHEQSPRLVAMPVPKTRLSIKKDGDSKRMSAIVVDSKETTQLECNKALSLDRSLANKKKENGRSTVFSSSPYNITLPPGISSDRADVDAGAHQVIPSRPPLPKKNILSMNSFSLKRNGRSSFFKSTFKDCRLQPTAVSSGGHADDVVVARKASKTTNQTVLVETSDQHNKTGSVKLAMTLLDDKNCNCSQSAVSNKSVPFSSPPRSYTKL